MLRCIAIVMAAAAIAWCAPLAASPEQSGSSEGGNFKPPAAQHRETPTLPARAPQPLRVPAERIGEVTKASIRALDLQTEFPRKIEPVRIPIPDELVWIGLIVALGLILYALRDSIPFLLRGGRGDWETAEDVAGASGLARELDALAAADALSHEGRFVEAMHMLLLQGLTDIRERSREQFADSLTSREILRGARLSAEGRTSLRAIIAAVERTYFGGYPAEPGDYAACRQDFDALRRALHGGASA